MKFKKKKQKQCEQDDHSSQFLQHTTLGMTRNIVQEQEIMDIEEETSVAQDFSALFLNELNEKLYLSMTRKALARIKLKIKLPPMCFTVKSLLGTAVEDLMGYL